MKGRIYMFVVGAVVAALAFYITREVPALLVYLGFFYLGVFSVVLRDVVDSQ